RAGHEYFGSKSAMIKFFSYFHLFFGLANLHSTATLDTIEATSCTPRTASNPVSDVALPIYPITCFHRSTHSEFRPLDPNSCSLIIDYIIATPRSNIDEWKFGPEGTNHNYTIPRRWATSGCVVFIRNTRPHETDIFKVLDIAVTAQRIITRCRHESEKDFRGGTSSIGTSYVKGLAVGVAAPQMEPPSHEDTVMVPDACARPPPPSPNVNVAPPLDVARRRVRNRELPRAVPADLERRSPIQAAGASVASEVPSASGAPTLPPFRKPFVSSDLEIECIPPESADSVVPIDCYSAIRMFLVNPNVLEKRYWHPGQNFFKIRNACEVYLGADEHGVVDEFSLIKAAYYASELADYCLRLRKVPYGGRIGIGNRRWYAPPLLKLRQSQLPRIPPLRLQVLPKPHVLAPDRVLPDLRQQEPRQRRAEEAQAAADEKGILPAARAALASRGVLLDDGEDVGADEGADLAAGGGDSIVLAADGGGAGFGGDEADVVAGPDFAKGEEDTG
ncbi:MAG: hypothetical protein Q9214_007128, partial [Letrouitia sp. 1 TL-2023]